MSPAKTAARRVEELRERRGELGLKRRDLYAHDDDWAQIVKLAKKLQMRRTKAAAKQKAPEPTAGDGPATNWQTGTQEGSDSRSTGRGGSPSNQAHISPQG